MKKITSNFVIWLMSGLLYLISKFCYLTCRKKFVNREIFDSVSARNIPIIYTCWHGRLYIVPHIRPEDKNVDCIVSNNKDGEIIAQILHKHGYGTIRGSANKIADERVNFKDKGGMKVIRSGVKALKKGVSLGLTPDGPRGPGRKFKTNALYMASLSGAKMLTFTYSCTKPIIFNSWDKFMIPTPFSKIILVFGEFFEIEKDSTKEELENYSRLIENNLNTITEKADQLCGLK